jgi:uncharacterized membrane protein
MSNDPAYIIWWWFLFFAIGTISIPLCWLIFKKFAGIGYGFAKTIGFLTIAYLSFVGGILHILPFTKLSLFIILFFYVSVNYYILIKYKQEISSQVLKNIRTLVAQEIIFTIGFIFWSYVRAHQPDMIGLEKFMDLGFINSILRAKYLPPVDMWFTGQPINYYWFGHFFVAVITKLSNIPSSITYNLMLASILGLVSMATFSISTTLIKSLNIKLDKRVIYAAGIISAILLVFAGNFHTPIYILREGRSKYWYPDATRFIGYNPDIDDKTIHEFPIYSFVVSDLHAHLINLPFVLLYISLLFNFTSSKTKQSKNILLIPLGFVLGVMFMTSTWDFGNYLLLTGIVLLIFNIRKYKFNIAVVLETGKTLATIFPISMLTALPFILNFDSLAKGVKLVNSHSPLWQLAILWGFPAVLTAIFVLLLVSFKKSIKWPDLFIASLFITSWALIAIPEFVYVKDIYVASHHRANTMFKLTYQAYVMFYLSSGYIAIRSLTLIKKKPIKLAALGLFTLLFTLILWYPSIAINSYYNNLKSYRGLNGETWLDDRYPNLYGSVLWLRKNVKGQPTILEAPGDSYTDFNVVSAYTGLPTVSGWFVHEWLWRGEASFPQARVTDIAQIYTSKNTTIAKSLLDKYKVKYIIIGPQEKRKYPDLNEKTFEQLGEIVFNSGDTRIFKLN